MNKKNVNIWGIFIILSIFIIILIFTLNPFNSLNVILMKERFFGSEEVNYNRNFEINKLTIKKCDYYYNLLTDKEKKLYSKIAQSVKELEKLAIIEDKKLELDERSISKVVEYFMYDHPEVFYLKQNYEIKRAFFFNTEYVVVGIDYTYNSLLEINDILTKIKDEAKSINNDLVSKSDFEKELFIHDYLVKKVEYYEENKNNKMKYHNIDSVFLEGKSLCDGISKAYQILLDNCGIDSILVTGKLDGKGHAWNLVNINQKWYNVDVTSDKLIKDNGEKVVTHLYFNVPSKSLDDLYKFNNQELYILADDIKYNYYIKTNNHIYLTDNFEMKLKDIVDQQKNNRILEFSTDYSKNVAKKIINSLYNINFDGYKENKNSINMKYYNNNNIYIILKK